MFILPIADSRLFPKNLAQKIRGREIKAIGA